MAIDSQQLLQSVVGVGRKWRPGVVLLEAAAFDQGDLQVIGNGYYGVLASDTGPAAARVFRIVEPFDVQWPGIHPVLVEPFDVLM